MAIYLQAGCTEKEASEAVWDGPDDNGIDAAFFDAATSRVISRKPNGSIRVPVNQKRKKSALFVKGVKDAVEQDDTSFHKRLQGQFADISLRIATPGTQVHLVVVSTGASGLASHGTSVLQGFLEELNGYDPNPIASSEIVGLSEVYAGLASDSTQGTVPLDATILEWSFISAPYPAYFGIIDGLQLKGWWKRSAAESYHGNMKIHEATNQYGNPTDKSIASREVRYFQ